jgi:hypothetical protein
MAEALLDLSLNAADTEAIVAYLNLAADWLAKARGLERESQEPGALRKNGGRKADLAKSEGQ